MEINTYNYREVLLAWLEGELTPAEMLQAEAYVLINEEAAREWKLLQRTKLQAEEKVFFPKKHLLYKEEEPVAVTSIISQPAVVEEVLVRKLSGGIDWRKWSLPLSIAAMLLMFIWFTVKNDVIKPGNSKIASKGEKVIDKKAGKEKQKIAGNTKETLVADKVKIQTKPAENSGTTKLENFAGNQISALNKSVAKNRNNPSHTKAFLAKARYGKAEDAPKMEAQKTELSIANIEISPKQIDHYRTLKTISYRHVVKDAANMRKWEKQQEENMLASTENSDVSRGTIGTLIHFFTNTIQVKRSEKDDAKIYALRLETEKIKIVKTFKSNF
ncbi:MAG: hypothetical protein EOP53_19835 [Sphingobacteriales bacterium]|nr:MAG: hypothetical protein EOP53_19835 [Sphingobacteriales bacterium]